MKVVFGPGGMGFTLMKDGVSRALVTRLAPGGTAFRLGVRTGRRACFYCKGALTVADDVVVF